MCLAHTRQLTPHRISPRALHRMHAELEAGCDYSNYSLYSLRAQPKGGRRSGHWVNCFCFPPIWRKKRNEQKKQKEILLIWLRLCCRWWMRNVDAAGAKEQCAEAGTEEPVPEEQEGASACHRDPADTPTQIWQGCLRVSLHNTHAYRDDNPPVPQNCTVVDSQGLCWCIYFPPPIKTDGRRTVSEPASESQTLQTPTGPLLYSCFGSDSISTPRCCTFQIN